MPLVQASGQDDQRAVPRQRVTNPRKMLALAACIMSFYLLLSSFVTTLLIPPSAYEVGGPASGRAVAYLAQQMFGNIFASAFDLSTILILWFAGASAMAGPTTRGFLGLISSRSQPLAACATVS